MIKGFLIVVFIALAFKALYLATYSQTLTDEDRKTLGLGPKGQGRR